MSALEQTRPATALTAAGFRNVFASLVAAVTTWNDARITRKSLSQLSARELDDIGLVRGDIDTISRRTYR